MRELLLSIASPGLLSWLGFLLLAAGLLGEVAILVEPFENHWTHKPLGFAFAAVVLAGYVIGHIGDDAISEGFAARAAKAELEFANIKTPRALTDENKEILLKCLQESPKGRVYIRPALLDTDGPLLAKQLEEAFKKADFVVVDWPEGPALGWSKAGIFLIVHQLENAQPHITAVQRCLFSIGIEARGDVDPKHLRMPFQLASVPGCSSS
jgi:hypothetical protein